MTTNSNEASQDYWENYYARSNGDLLPTPSQFAVFVQGELSGPAFVVDVGCGTGRDSLFFSSRGHAVLGLDQAKAAIGRCTQSATKAGLSARFEEASVLEQDLPARALTGAPDTLMRVVYARFFLHAITDEAEDAFLKAARQICGVGGLLAVEFRTVRDKALAKVTEAHYRRYIEPSQLISKAALLGFSCEYLVEGFGFAKYQQDDAYVARLMLRVT